MNQKPILYLVIPCYNEEEVLPESCHRLSAKMNEMIGNQLIADGSKIVFVDDGFKDNTRTMIQEYHASNPLVSGVFLSRNRGQQNAILAGLMTVKDKCDIMITLDVDLQDDIEVLDQFIKEYQNGAEIVYGVRSSRKKDSFFKRVPALGFYKLMKKMGIDIVYNHAEYRLMTKRVIDELSNFREVHLFLRGLLPLIGFKSAVVYYERDVRFAGETKYSPKRMFALAVDGITSFSIKPIRLITNLGVFIFFVSIIMMAYFLVRYFTGHTLVGWSSLAVSIWAIGGLQLLAIGIVGEYIGKIYLETKARPRYIIEEFLN
jgi:glycosyltransferase involved in cell wall biosynthesis